MLKRTPLKRGTKPLNKGTKGLKKVRRSSTTTLEDLHRMWNMFLEIWEERRQTDGNVYSELSGKNLGRECKTVYMDHLLEKSSYEELKYEKRNICVCTWEEHANKGGPAEHPKHRELINKAKEELL